MTRLKGMADGKFVFTVCVNDGQLTQSTGGKGTHMIRYPTRRGVIEFSSDAGWILLFTLVTLWFLRVAGVLR